MKGTTTASSQGLARIGLAIIFVFMTVVAGRALLTVELTFPSPASSAMPHPTPDSIPNVAGSHG